MGDRPTTVQAMYFDGRSARGRLVSLQVMGAALVAEAVVESPGPNPKDADPGPWRWPLPSVHWPERTRHGKRVIHLASGGSLQVVDAQAFDAWRHSLPGVERSESWVVKAQQSWKATLAAAMLLVLVGLAGYRWGVPLAGQAVVNAIPTRIDTSLGQVVYRQLRSELLKPSRLPDDRQADLRARFDQMVERAVPATERVPVVLIFHSARETIGPNALALPGGTIIMTDELVKMLDGHDDTILGVLAHEYGHVQRRHGMRALVQFALLSTASSVALGDFSGVLAAAPAWFGQLGYSRDAEREADQDAARMLRASGRDPAVMGVLFDRLEMRRDERQPPIAFASHPLGAERRAFFEQASKARGSPAAR